MTERGPLQTYEIVWHSGHTEHIQAHQVSWSGGAMSLFSPTEADKPRRVMFHADLDGQWRLQLMAIEADIRTIRNVATEIHVGDGGAS